MTQECPNSTPAPRTGSKRLKKVLISVLVVGLCLAIRYYWPTQPAKAQVADEGPPRRLKSPEPADARTSAVSHSSRSASDRSKFSGQAIVATVNTQRITRDDLAAQCRQTFGAEVLESMVNRQLIVEECQRRGIVVTHADVDAEIERMAKRFNIPVDQWFKMLKQERNVTPQQYADDIIWPTLALRKIAGERLTISRDELVKEFEIEYGEQVRARLIAVSSPDRARKLHAQAVAQPQDFGNLAKQYSEDAASASAKGIINPIRRHGSYQEIEDAVFNMADGDVSPVIHAGGQYLILQRVGLVPAKQVKFEQAAPRLEEALRDRKMHPVAQDIFRQLQENAKLENVWNDRLKQTQMPGVAATINGTPIAIRDLDEQCIAHHGPEVLEGMVNRKLLEQACQQKNITITEADLQAEIVRAASIGVKPKADGSPDVNAWLQLVTKKQGIPLATYRSDVVWPTAALKKLVGDKVKVSDEDLRKGFEANYGPRIRCLAIVMGNQRRAQQVFEMARKNNTTEYFGELAAQYSIEPGSQAMHGEVPPIKRHGGQPQLEDEAFQLRPGELSGIIQMGDKFILLRCEGYTKAASVDFATVRADLYEDIHEKMLRVAMGEYFEKLQESATIDNYLAGTSHSAKPEHAAQRPQLRQVPAE